MLRCGSCCQETACGDLAKAIAELDLALQLEAKEMIFALSSRGEAKRELGDLAGAAAELDLALQLEANKILFVLRRRAARPRDGVW